ncbi:unnamed protein product [Moneuplotes crassus]|uniref:Ubiquitin-like domain-containing protein n=1 Tax=Euplotes crassus TaxID=5936 RepID=A0AAD1Y5E9_EUPCR|nr:unnamed protein product [Moneuplotes crassus]
MESHSSEEIIVNVVTLSSHTIPFYVDKGITAGELRDKFEQRTGVQRNNCAFIYKGKDCYDEFLFSSLPFDNGDTIHCVFRQREGQTFDEISELIQNATL